MDNLAEAFALSADISNTPNDTHKPHPRFAQYKQTPNFSDQQKRREQLLEHQKEKRQELYSLARGLNSKLKNDEAVKALNEALEAAVRDAEAAEKSLRDAEAAEKSLMDAEAMDTSKKATKKPEERVPRYRDQLMLSEWLVSVPNPVEFETKWLMVPCPQGRRTLIVATKGRTQAFSKAGHLTATFPSILPGGSADGPRKLSTILDCIWNFENKMYFILDVLAWSNQPLLDCDTDFRFYWLKTKLQETPELKETSTTHRYKFGALPHYECTRENMTKVMATYPLFAGGSPNLDGLLFYHRETHYVHGTTPLVGWLKPYMLPDILQIPVNEAYENMRPAGYESLEKHIEKAAEKAAEDSKNRGHWRRERRGHGGARGQGRRGQVDVNMQDGDIQQMDATGYHSVM